MEQSFHFSKPFLKKTALQMFYRIYNEKKGDELQKCLKEYRQTMLDEGLTNEEIAIIEQEVKISTINNQTR